MFSVTLQFLKTYLYQNICLCFITLKWHHNQFNYRSMAFSRRKIKIYKGLNISMHQAFKADLTTWLKEIHVQYSPSVFSPARSPPRTIFLSPPADLRTCPLSIPRRDTLIPPRIRRGPAVVPPDTAMGLQCQMMTS